MNVLASALILLGAAIALIAGIGLLRFETPYARLHAAGKASPIAFIAVALGAGTELGWSGAARLAVAIAALVLTLPVGVHLLFRAVHRTAHHPLIIDDLAKAEFVAPPHEPGETP